MKHQSHYKYVPRWEIFMEKELRVGLDLGRLAVLKKMGLGRLWAFFVGVFFIFFRGKKNVKNILGSAGRTNKLYKMKFFFLKNLKNNNILFDSL